jgi:hypothetical protein
MKQNPNTIYIAAGSGDTEGIRKKVEKLGISDRFYMPGFVDAHLYGHIIELWLDTFPLSQGASRDEYLHKENKVAVLLREPHYGIDMVPKEWLELKKDCENLIVSVLCFFDDCLSVLKDLIDKNPSYKIFFVTNKESVFNNLAKQVPSEANLSFIKMDDDAIKQISDIQLFTRNKECFFDKANYYLYRKKPFLGRNIAYKNNPIERMSEHIKRIMLDEKGYSDMDDNLCFSKDEYLSTAQNLISNKAAIKHIAYVQKIYRDELYKLVKIDTLNTIIDLLFDE